MTIGLAFWVVMLVALIFGAVEMRKTDWKLTVPSFAIWFLLFLVGWKVFGFPLQG